MTLVNALPDEIPEVTAQEHFGNRGGGSSRSQQQRQQTQTQTQQQQQQSWLNARDEKLLYEAARARVDQVQGYVEPPAAAAAVPVAAAPQTSNESVEDEKIRYERARQAALGTQGGQVYGEVPRVNATVAGGAGGVGGAAVGTSEKKTGAALYTQAITARNQALAQQQQGSAVVAVTPSPTGSPNASAHSPRYPSADQEKEALKRYEQAKLAVDRVQNPPSRGAPIAYEHLYPSGGGGGSGASSAPPPANDLPPPFESGSGGGGGGGGSALSAFEEKERLKKQFEQQEATTNTAVANAYSSPPPSPPVPANGTAARNSPPPPSFSYREPVGAAQIKKALSEKDILRRKYEAEASAARQPPPQSPPPPQSSPPTSPQRSGSASTPTTKANARLSATPARSASGTGNVRGSRPQPSAPAAGSASIRVLTAAEEKAQLKAQWAAQDAMASGSPQRSPPSHSNGTMYTPPSSPGRPGLQSGVSMSGSPAQSPRLPVVQEQQQLRTPPAPPPLMPRPPAEYIQETQEEDARVSRVVGVFSPTVGDDMVVTPSHHHHRPARTASMLKPGGGLGNGALDGRPFSPMNHSAGVNGA